MRAAILSLLLMSATTPALSQDAYLSYANPAYAPGTTIALDANDVLSSDEDHECRQRTGILISCIIRKDARFLVCDGVVECHEFTDIASALALYRID